MNKKIMVCDDDAEILDMIQLVLELEGYEVVCEVDSRKMVGNIKQQKPDVLVIDLWMPVVSGDMVVRQLQSETPATMPKVMVMSASRDGRLIANQIGADGFLPKPFDVAVLLDKIAALS